MGCRRKTEKDYHDLVKGRGFKWVGLLPKNTHTKTWWECEKGHKWDAKYSDIYSGNGCPVCAEHVPKIEKDYHNLAKFRGFKWAGPFPKTTHRKTRWKCEKGHEWEARYNDIYNGVGCPHCAGLAKKVEKNYHCLAKSQGFKWVGGVLPQNVCTKTQWECEKNHRWKTVYNNIRNGTGCPYCAGNAKKTKDDYHKLAEGRELKWADDILPQNVCIKTWWECEKEHKWKATYSDIYSGNSCPYCAGKARKTEKDYYNLAKSRKFVWLGPFVKNINVKTRWGCEKGHKWKAAYNSIYMGNGCPHCQDIINGAPVSKPQRRLNDLLYGSLNYPEGKCRIDVAIMRNSQKIAVEYDCQYWHKGREKQDAKRDQHLVFRGWKILHIKSGNLLPKRKQLSIAIDYLLETNNVVYNLYLEDWKV